MLPRESYPSDSGARRVQSTLRILPCLTIPVSHASSSSNASAMTAGDHRRSTFLDTVLPVSMLRSQYSVKRRGESHIQSHWTGRGLHQQNIDAAQAQLRVSIIPMTTPSSTLDSNRQCSIDINKYGAQE